VKQPCFFLARTSHRTAPGKKQKQTLNMKHILLFGVFGLLSFQVVSKTIYVKPTGNGDGSSWSAAESDLCKALQKAEQGDQVWVAAGTYYPTKTQSRSISFLIPAGVKVYGGFAGTETSLQQRNCQKYKSVLSGNIGSKDEPTDNSYTVVLLAEAHENNLLDGFVITDGNADGSGPTADIERCGGGLYIKAGNGQTLTKPKIQNCIFKDNYARDGGAVYVNGRKKACNPEFRNCKFLGNTANLDGGAVYNDGRHDGMANPSFYGCTFSNNKSNYGGAICNYGGGGESSPSIRNCVFQANEAYLRGGAIFNMDIGGMTAPSLNGCQFVDNKAVAGKGMYTFSKYGQKEEGDLNGISANTNK